MEIFDKLYVVHEEGSLRSYNDIIDIMFPIGKIYSNVKTYKDKECTKIQGSEGRRSLFDLLALCNSYLPKADEQELLDALRDNYIHFGYCFDIGRIVFYNGSSDKDDTYREYSRHDIEYFKKDDGGSYDDEEEYYEDDEVV